MRFRKFQTAARWSGAWNDLSALPTASRNCQARDTLEHPLATVNQKYKRPATSGQSRSGIGDSSGENCPTLTLICTILVHQHTVTEIFAFFCNRLSASRFRTKLEISAGKRPRASM